MRKSRFTDEQIIKALKEHAAGLSRTSYAGSTVLATRRSTSGDPDMAICILDARKLKALEDENRRLKKLLAESMLDASTLKEMHRPGERLYGSRENSPG